MKSLYFIVILLVLVGGCGLLSDADEKIIFGETRKPIDLEREYRALASEIQSFKPCYLIHPDSLRKSGFASIGNQVSYLRSRCFLAVARQTGDRDICSSVRSVSTIFLSGADMNADLCRQVAGSGGSSPSLDVELMVGLAGYTKGEVDAYLVIEQRFTSLEAASRFRREKPDVYWGEVRRHLLHSADFFERTRSFPGFASAADEAKMRSLPWSPPVQRPWVAPEQRRRSVPEVRVRAASD